MSWLRADTRIRMRMGISWTNTPSPPWREEPMVTQAGPGWGATLAANASSSPSTMGSRWWQPAAMQIGHDAAPSLSLPRVPKIQKLLYLPVSPDKNKAATGVKCWGGRWVHVFTCERIPKKKRAKVSASRHLGGRAGGRPSLYTPF